MPRAIAVVGSSVSLYVRPPRQTPDQGTYVEVLRRSLGPTYHITNLARVSYDFRDAVHRFHRDLLPLAPDIVIVHLGVNESVSRFLPRWLWRLVFGGRDRITDPGPTRRLFMLTDALLRPWATRLVPRAWFSADEFERMVRELLANVRKEFAAKTLVVGITQPSQRVEQELRGSQERVRRFNTILARCASEHGATFIDMEEVATRLELHPDGIHFSAAGHTWLAKRLADAIR